MVSIKAHSPRKVFHLLTLVSLLLLIKEPTLTCQARELEGNAETLQTSNGTVHWSILVKIKPRPGSTGAASILLIDSGGTTITTFSGVVLPYSGLAIGIEGPRRDVHDGDTPFGVYKFAATEGGTAQSQLQRGYGTGKIYLDDNDLYGEVADANRSLIRLHGGGSALANPYELDQPLRATRGCIRMRNQDINDLIQRLKHLTTENAVQFIFMGDAAYLNALATDATLSGKPWWSVLRTDLHIPDTAPNTYALMGSALATSSEHVAQPLISAPDIEGTQSSDSLIDLVNLFAEDVGPKGEEALNALRPRIAELIDLQNKLPTDDGLRPKLAFVFCILDHECDSNMLVLQTSLMDSSHYKGFFADQAQDMISRVIDREESRGNEEASKDLTMSLFAAVPKADGALSDGLGITLSNKLRTQTGLFFSAWGAHFSTIPVGESTTVKSKAFGLMRATHHLTFGEVSKIRKYLYLVHDYSQEFGQAVQDFTQMYFRVSAPNRARRSARR